MAGLNLPRFGGYVAALDFILAVSHGQGEDGGAHAGSGHGLQSWRGPAMSGPSGSGGVRAVDEAIRHWVEEGGLDAGIRNDGRTTFEREASRGHLQMMRVGNIRG